MNHITQIDPIENLLRGFFVRPADAEDARKVPSFRMDVREDDEAFHVQAELPGILKEDIHVVVDGGQVSISAEAKRESAEREGSRVLRSERYFGKVSRSFRLAQDVDDSRAAARFKDGVLELTLPKRTVATSRRLSID